jgi:putative transposase
MTAAPQIILAPSEQWISTEAAMKHTGWTDRWLRAKAATGAVISRASATSAANGKAQREYLSSSLPSMQTTALAIVPPPAAALGPLFAAAPAEPEARIVLADPEAKAQAEERLALLQPILDYSKDPERYAALEISRGRRVTSLERMIEYVAATSSPHVSPRTLKRWLARYRKQGGGNALADRIRADKGHSRWFAQHHNVAAFAAWMYLGDIDQRRIPAGERPQMPQSVADVYRRIAENAVLLGLSREDMPSRETVRAFLDREVSPAMKILAREGRHSYRERISPYMTRTYSDVYAGDVWVCDHMIHDVEVANNLFHDAPWGAPIRMRLTAFIDLRSRRVMGVCWSWEGSSRSLSAALNNGLVYGAPRLIYTDNGKDMHRFGKGAQRGSETYQARSPLAPADWWCTEIEQIEKTGFAARLGISMQYCIPRHPQSKHIERFFRTLHMQFDALWRTYTSGSPFTRPDATGEAMMQHRWLLNAGRVAESKHPMASEVITGCLAWIERYNNTPHSGQGLDGRTPNEVFAAERNPEQRPIPDEATRALLMCDFERRQVRECAITLEKRRYQPRPNDQQAWVTMHELSGRSADVLIAHDPADPEYAALCDLDGRFLAWLECEPLVRFAPGDDWTQQQIGQSMEMRRGLEKATRQTITAIASAARAQGVRSAVDELCSRPQLPAALDTLTTQRKRKLRPDSTAVAPASALDIANGFLEALKK